jgi:hypothetical protein
MVEVEELQIGVELGQAKRVLKDIRIAGESSPLRQIEVVPRLLMSGGKKMPRQLFRANSR